MNATNQRVGGGPNKVALGADVVVGVWLLLSPLYACLAADDTLTGQVKDDAKQAAAAVNSAVEETRTAVKEAGQSVANSFEALWQRVDESRLKNRTPDEIVGWVIMGIMVGASVGLMTASKTDGRGKFGTLLWGLGGALLGGTAVHLARIDFGWGPVLIRYEELFFAMLGALVLVVLGPVVRRRMRGKKSARRN